MTRQKWLSLKLPLHYHRPLYSLDCSKSTASSDLQTNRAAACAVMRALDGAHEPPPREIMIPRFLDFLNIFSIENFH